MPHNRAAEIRRQLRARKAPVREHRSDRRILCLVPAAERLGNPPMHHGELRRMRRRERTRRRPDPEHHACARQALPLVREIVDTDAVRRMMIQFQRIVSDEERRRRPVRHRILRRERTRLIGRCRPVAAAQDDLQQRMGRCRLIREQDTLRADLLGRHARDEQHAPHIAVRGDAHIRQDEQFIRMPRVRDRRHARHIEPLCLQAPVQLRRRGAQDIQPLRRPMRERIRQRQHIQERDMP